jgi:hypothetical protein
VARVPVVTALHVRARYGPTARGSNERDRDQAGLRPRA